MTREKNKNLEANNVKRENFSVETQNHSIPKIDLKPALLAAGKLAIAARRVTTANTKNLSQRIEQMETALDIYDAEILSLNTR